MSSTEKEKHEGLEADVVVLGSGGGLAAAIAAAEEGASVILLEKVNIIGGYTRQANGFTACESPVQQRQNITVTSDQLFKHIMNWSHWSRVNPRVVRAYVNKTGDTIRWLEEKGVEFEDVDETIGGNMAIGHMPKGLGNAMQKALIKSARSLGVNIINNTSGKKILQDAGGRISGVLAVGKTGEEFLIKAKSVVIATGGFGNNRELLKKYCPDYYDDMHLDLWPHREAHSGDGLLMAEEIGAAIADEIPIYHLGPYYPGFMYPWMSVLAMAIDRRTVWVNTDGKRFVDEAGYDVWELGNAILLQPGKVMYSLCDDKIRSALESEGRLRRHSKQDEERLIKDFTGLRGELQKQVEAGGTMIADTWDGIAGWIGADPEVLKAEIDQYNAYCDQGRDEIFARTENMHPLRQPPYYAMRCCARVGETLGGIKTDENMAALDMQRQVIPGAYVAGVLVDGFVPQTNCVSPMGFAVNTGRIAGENAARYALGK
jgi:fumarate reductase flavoprotein subunit